MALPEGGDGVFFAIGSLRRDRYEINISIRIIIVTKRLLTPFSFPIKFGLRLDDPHAPSASYPMNNRINPLAGFLCIFLFIPQVASAAVAYTNSLKDTVKVLTDFTDYTTIDSDYINTPTGGYFLVDTNNGLELISTAPNYVDGLGAFNRILKASNDWKITIQSHISAFTNNQTNPFYSAGISLVKTSINGLEYPNRVDLNLCRTVGIGGSLSNSIVSSLYINNGETDKVANKNLTDAYLQFIFKASSKTLTTGYSTNGSNFSTIQSYNLGTSWGIKPTDGFTLGVAANDQPDGRVIPIYSVTPGQMYLNNLTINSPTAQENPATNQGGGVTGGSLSGSLSLGANGANGVTTVNGGFNTYMGGGVVTGGTLIFNNAYTNTNGTWILNTNILTNSGSITNTNSNTNILGGGGFTNGGNNGFTNTNSFGGGSFTNTNSIGGGSIGGVVLPPGFVTGGIVTNSNPPLN